MKNNVNLQPYNSFGFNAVAKYFVEIHNIQQLEALITTDVFKQKKHLVLSGGNNVLFQDDVFDGLVIFINTKGVEILREDENEVIIRAQAGEDWPDFVKFTVWKGWYGLENLAHIPGKVGAAPVQNIGAYGMELKDSFLQCEAFELETGKTKVFGKEECRFSYRESIFKNELKGQFIITSVDFLLKKNAPLHLDYGNIKAYLEQNGIEKPTLLQLHDAICAIRDAKLPDVKQIGSAGSFFKNPTSTLEFMTNKPSSSCITAAERDKTLWILPAKSKIPWRPSSGFGLARRSISFSQIVAENKIVTAITVMAITIFRIKQKQFDFQLVIHLRESKNQDAISFLPTRAFGPPWLSLFPSKPWPQNARLASSVHKPKPPF